MKEYSVILNENEFKLFKLIQSINIYPTLKNDLLESLTKQVTHFSQLTSPKKTQKWLQIGDRTLLESINPVRVEENSPLASDIITEQRKRINVEE
ncbi:hypothetical protein BGP_5319 [Beggiatoa sp. PS]|nr:hypothetical protein BGP_5319 [Beggiatoa sp. PS]